MKIDALCPLKMQTAPNALKRIQKKQFTLISTLRIFNVKKNG
jgi:hypothetical protein